MNETTKKPKAKNNASVADLADACERVTRMTTDEQAKHKAIKDASAHAKELAAERKAIMDAILAAHPEEVARMDEAERKRQAAIEFAKVESHELLSGWNARTTKATDAILRGVPEVVARRVHQEVHRLRQKRAIAGDE